MSRALGMALAALVFAGGARAIDLTGTYDMDILLGGPDCPLQVVQDGSSIQLFDPGGCWGFAWQGIASGTVDPLTGEFSAAGLLCEGFPSSVQGSGDGTELAFWLSCGGVPVYVLGTRLAVPSPSPTPVPTLVPTPTPTQTPAPTKKLKKSKKQAKKAKKAKKLKLKKRKKLKKQKK